MTTNSTHAQACIPFPAPCSPPSPTHTTARSGYHRTQLSSTVYVSVRRACLHIDGLATRCAFRAPLSNAHAVASPDGPPPPLNQRPTHTKIRIPGHGKMCHAHLSPRAGTPPNPHHPDPRPPRHLHLITHTLRPHCRPYSPIQCRVSKNASSRRNCTTVTYHSAPGGRSPVCAAIEWCTQVSRAATHASREWIKSQLLAWKRRPTEIMRPSKRHTHQCGGQVV